MPNLSRREFEVYMMIVESAMTPSDIARQLGLSVGTVRWNYVPGCLRKMKVNTMLELLVQYHKRERMA